jgi:hypothetical protein
MIFFITGKPGDGKSLYAVRRLLDDLINRECYVVTNIPLVLSKVHEYVSARLPADVPFDLESRLKVIPDSEVYEFYRHRSGGLTLPWSPDHDAKDDGAKRGTRAEFVEWMKTQSFALMSQSTEYQKPVHFYIDEAHNFFNSREWANCARSVLYYASQHRHLHDNIFLITQVMENVEKQLRSLVSETYITRNQLRRRIGPVRLRPVFSVQCYYGVPAPTVKPYDNPKFALDAAGIASCYKTVGALGVQSKPEKIENKGWLPWWSLWIGAALLLAAIIFAFVGLPYLGGMAGRAMVQAPAAALAESQGLKIPGGNIDNNGNIAVSKKGPLPSSDLRGRAPGDDQSALDLWVTGYIRRGQRWTLSLSDGRTFSEDDPAVSLVGVNFAVVDGRKVYFRRQRSGSAPAPAADPLPAPAADPLPVSPASAPVVAASDEGAWVRGSDGVARLREKQAIGR